MYMSLILLKTFDNAIDAHILKARLEGEGVRCYIFDEHIVTLNPLYSLSVGGIKLKIDESDLELARLILADIRNTPFTTEEDMVIVCPRCQSDKLISGYRSFRGVDGFFSALFSLLLSVFPLYYRSVYKCTRCGKEFREQRTF